MDFRQYLEHFGWSQAELARRIGVTPDTVSRWKGQAPQVVLMYLEELKRNEDIAGQFSDKWERFNLDLIAFLNTYEVAT